MHLIPRRQKQEDGGRALGRPASVLEFKDQIDRVFDRLLADPWGAFKDEVPFEGLLPAVDVTENDEHIVVQAELPGIDPEKLNLTVTGEAMTISGEKEESDESRGDSCFHAERRFGSFRRRIPLPACVNADDVNATYKDGVLRVQLTKSPEGRAKRIRVSGG